MPRPQSPLTQYILSLGNQLSAKDVVAKVAARGFTTTEKNVHRVRQLSSGTVGKAAKKAKPAKAANKPKTAAKAKSGGRGKSGKAGGNKSDFVRSFGLDTPAKEIVASGKAKGINFGIPYVYAVRTGDKVRAQKSGASRGNKIKGASSNFARASVKTGSNGKAVTNVKAEAVFRATAVAYVVEYGVPRARALFEQVAKSATSGRP